MVGSGGWWCELLKKQCVGREVIGVKGEVVLVEKDEVDVEERLFMSNGCYMVGKEGNGLLIGGRSEFKNQSVGR